MKVAIAHNFYRSDQPSGENAVVLADAAALQAAGVTTQPYFEYSDRLDAHPLAAAALAAPGVVYAPGTVRRLRQAMADDPPDVLHVHNLVPLLSPWLIKAAQGLGIPVVATVHNYRMACLAGTFFRAGSICTQCDGRRLPTAGIRHRCYRGSGAQSLAAGVGQLAHQGTWRSLNAYIVLNDFMAEYLRRQGIRPDLVHVRPTSSNEGPQPPSATGRDVLFMGRLDAAKGLPMLLEAWSLAQASKHGRKLVIAGTGPLEQFVQQAAAADPSIDYVGAVAGGQWEHALSRACVVVVPSVWFEGYPRIVAEAFARGRPVLATRIGSLARIISNANGYLVEPTAADLGRALDQLDDADLRRKGESARRHWEQHLRPDITTAALIGVYRSVIDARS
jgi:glycosyltransferase involved in cell wall biosynthesis